MSVKNSAPVDRLGATPRFLSFVNQLFHHVDRVASRVEFLEKAAAAVSDVLRTARVELRIMEAEKFYRCQYRRSPGPGFHWLPMPFPARLGGKRLPVLETDSPFEAFCLQRFTGETKRKPGPVFSGAAPLDDLFVDEKPHAARSKAARSVGVFPLEVERRHLGLLIVPERRRFFTPRAIKLCVGVADVLAIALVHQRVLTALRERVKEQTCLSKISKLMAQPQAELEAILQGVVNVLPPAWRHPDLASSRIIVDRQSYESPGFRDGPARQTAPIVVAGATRGQIEVVYAEARPNLDEGPFLQEERNLIDIVAQQVAFLIEEKQAQASQEQLEAQLRHADRLATIGQLAGGVAHELNEPLAGILGFSQLVLKNPDLPPAVVKDLERIKTAALHSREVIRKLLIFGRRLPTQRRPVSLNKAVEEALSILVYLLTKEGITTETRLAPDLPMFEADPAQLVQVVVNLVVNALQAMPQGGTLTVATEAEPNAIVLIVQDTGVGMSAATQAKIFMPFFTTKDVRQGTGLGLPVVHGIVTGLGGAIELDSEVGRGTRFVIRFPRQAAPPTDRDA